MGAASLHIIEEFVYPGGFAAWDRQYRPDIAKSITPRFHIIINALLFALCFYVGALGSRPAGVAAWLTVMALLFGNALWHARGAIRTKSYSPGMVTGLFLYVPLTVYGYFRFLSSGQASFPTAIIAAAIGGSYPFWSKVLHNRRAERRGK